MHAVMIHARETRGTGIGAAKDRRDKERNTSPQRDSPRTRYGLLGAMPKFRSV